MCTEATACQEPWRPRSDLRRQFISYLHSGVRGPSLCPFIHGQYATRPQSNNRSCRVDLPTTSPVATTLAHRHQLQRGRHAGKASCTPRLQHTCLVAEKTSAKGCFSAAPLCRSHATHPLMQLHKMHRARMCKCAPQPSVLKPWRVGDMSRQHVNPWTPPAPAQAQVPKHAKVDCTQKKFITERGSRRQ